MKGDTYMDQGYFNRLLSKALQQDASIVQLVKVAAGEEAGSPSGGEGSHRETLATLGARVASLEKLLRLQDQSRPSPAAAASPEKSAGAATGESKPEWLFPLAASELRLLQRNWNALEQSAEAMAVHLDAMVHPAKENDSRERALTVLHLADALTSQERLGPLTAKAVAPLRQSLALTKRCQECAALRTIPASGPTIGLLDRLREANLFLGVLLFSEQAREPLLLDIDAWLSEQLPRLADAFYREYQTARYRNAAQPLEEPRRTLDALLESIGLRVMPISLGRTGFDSQLHIARAATKDADMADAAIAGVVRNGLERLDGTVVQQAEVIVNRI